jgi:putative addiction module antidote
MRMKLRKIGNSLGTTWPKDALARMNVKEGDELYIVATQDGVLVTPYDPKFEKTMATAQRIMARDREALKELSRR